MLEDGGMDSNMIKSKKIVEQYLEVLHCNRCGKVIETPKNETWENRKHPVGEEIIYEYKCDCGWSTTSKILYPFVRMEFDETDNSIQIGDEVEAWDTNAWIRFVAWGEECGAIYGYGENGGAYEYPISSCRKTGRRFELKLIENNAE